MNANIERKLIFLNIGMQICLVQQSQCKKCGATIPTDLLVLLGQIQISLILLSNM